MVERVFYILWNIAMKSNVLHCSHVWSAIFGGELDQGIKKQDILLNSPLPKADTPETLTAWPSEYVAAR